MAFWFLLSPFSYVPLGFPNHQCLWGLSLGISGLWQNKRCLPVCMFQDWSPVCLHNSAGRRDKDSVWTMLFRLLPRLLYITSKHWLGWVYTNVIMFPFPNNRSFSHFLHTWVKPHQWPRLLAVVTGMALTASSLCFSRVNVPKDL